MKPEDFELMRSLLKAKSGLIVQPDKVYLLESRLTPVARAHNLDGLEALVDTVRRTKDPKLIEEITDAMTTNESFFFRDNTPFDILKKNVLPILEKKRTSRTLKIWCAAASSGQEPYSIAMILKEQMPKWENWNIDIYGTDISRKILEKAREGRYSQFEVQRGLPVQMMIKYFDQRGDGWYIGDEIRKMVRYEYMNLLDTFGVLPQFDIVFCRNVLIYFDPETKADTLAKIRKVMRDDGALFLGAAETVLGISKEFRPVKGQRGIYVPTASEDHLYEDV